MTQAEDEKTGKAEDANDVTGIVLDLPSRAADTGLRLRDVLRGVFFGLLSPTLASNLASSVLEKTGKAEDANDVTGIVLDLSSRAADTGLRLRDALRGVFFGLLSATLASNLVSSVLLEVVSEA